MSLRQLSIQWKITLLAGLCLLGIVTLLVGLSLYRMAQSSQQVKASSMQMLDEAAQSRIEAQGEVQALGIRQQFMDAYQYGHGFSRQVLFLREQAEKRFLDAFDTREDLTRQVKAALQANPDLLGLSLVFEANALDGKDELFANQAELGSNDKGRFALYWSQPTPGKITSMALPESDMADTSIGPSGEKANAWFTCPRTTLKPCVIEPYFYVIDGQNVLMTSIVFPLMVNGKVIASLSVDINLNSLQAVSQQASQKLYDGQTQVSILSPTGLLAGYSPDASKLSQRLEQVDPASGAQLTSALASSTQTHSLRTDHQLKVLAPFAPIPGGKAWGVLLDVPEKVLVAPAEALKNQLDADNAKGTLLELGLGLLAAVVGLILVWLMARSVTRPILGVAHMLEDIASGEGDLTRRLAYAKQDELGQLAGWFNRFLDKLQPIIAEVKRSVQDARGTADQSAAIATQTSAGMEQQYRQVDQVATASHEMSATAQDVARSAAQAAQAARDADQATRQGLTVIDRTTANIGELAADMSTAMTQVEGLAANSEQIGSVLEVIRGIAEQTNLLALNAAIEAARAGEAGRGFAVVADEVRNLASRTRQATDEISGMIQSIQQETGNAISTMEHGNALMQEGLSRNADVASALARIDEQSRSAGQQFAAITTATQEQSSTATLLSSNLQSIALANSEQREVVSNLAVTAKELETLAAGLRHEVDRFR